MNTSITLPAWQRPHWHASDETVVLQFYVFGKFEGGRVPSERYGSDGLPEGVTLTSHHHADLRAWEGYPLKGELGRLFREEAPQAYKRAIDAPQVLVVRGQFPDPADTGYLRDTLGVLAALLDVGAVAILDPQILTLFDAERWRRHYLVRDGAPLRNHLLILRDGEQREGYARIHTRGMRKFGRPDVVIEQVPDALVDRAGVLCEQLIQMQALGAHFSDGQTIDLDGAHGQLVARLGGGLDDPQFGNSWVRLRWPE